eukprot:CAMPEP_0197644362 /NCGR_PEP_ID=MMETSP1338-20131121/17365_1 /TAXON_ID=43686 ORGANISM="Pelagodinium beii, Strain RCC1491" /NCGR_SAMPLE_ID=MMETSP1338 /ASSEMBLY_ACC=CAM_ASM_000754 /LENGTH=294 /DNA_ID=CAMNT_0043217749 /DNA_START=32 /DNA_END=913 /DNA_ORIENTATION=-
MAKYGRVIAQTGSVPPDVEKMVKAGQNNQKAIDLFPEGSAQARDTNGIVELDLEKDDHPKNVLIEKSRKKIKLSHGEPEPVKICASPADFQPWKASVSSSHGAETLQLLREALAARGFQKRELLVLAGEAGNCYANVITGTYVELGKDESHKPCYQKVTMSKLSESAVSQESYIYWSVEDSCWEIGCMRPGKGCVAFASLPSTTPCGNQSWHILRNDFGTSSQSSSAKSCAEASAHDAEKAPVKAEAKAEDRVKAPVKAEAKAEASAKAQVQVKAEAKAETSAKTPTKAKASAK